MSSPVVTSTRASLDLLCCQSANGRHRGIGRYASGLTRALATADTPQDRTFVLARQDPGSLDEITEACRDVLPVHRIKTIALPRIRAHSLAVDSPAAAMQAAAIARAHARLCPDIVHDFSPFEPELSRPLSGECPGFLRTATVHDFIPLLYPGQYLGSPSALRWYHACLARLRTHDILFAVSEATRRDAIRLLDIPPERIVTVYGACDSVFRPGETPPSQLAGLYSRLGLSRPCVLYTAGMDPRKNIDGAIRAYALLSPSLRATHHLVIVCAVSPEERAQLSRIAARAGLAPGELILTGRVPDDDLVMLYRECRAFVFPSHHEGLGLPVLEAIACGAPAIVADNSSLVEIIDRPDARFDSHDDRAFSAKLGEVLTDTGFRRSLSETGAARSAAFSWEKTARLVRETWRSALGERRAALESPSRPCTVTRPRPRLACVTPLPPQQTGIADYSAELIEALDAYYDIELFTTAPAVDGRFSRFRVHPVEALDTLGHRFDRILYQVGNNEYHAAMFDLMTRWPGVIDLHDYYLSSIIAWMGGDLFARELLATHGPGVAETFVTARDQVSLIQRHSANRHVFEHALGVIVHNRHALALAAADYPEGPPAPLELVLHPRRDTGLARSPRRTEARTRLGLSDDTLVLCTFGHVAHPKCPDVLLAAFESLLVTRPSCKLHLVYVGQPNDSSEIRRFRANLDASPALPAVTITGFAAPAVYADWLAAADIGVQLRRDSRGESSGATLDAMAAGLPVVVNTHGGFADFPADVLVHLPETAAAAPLAQALLALVDSPGRRDELGRAALRHVAVHHNPATLARRYHDVMEHFVASGHGRDPRRLVASVQRSGARRRDIASWISSLATHDISLRPPRAYVDAGDGDPAEAAQARALQAALAGEGIEAWLVHPRGAQLHTRLPSVAGRPVAVRPRHGDTARLLPRRHRSRPLIDALTRAGVRVLPHDLP